MKQTHDQRYGQLVTVNNAKEQLYQYKVTSGGKTKEFPMYKNIGGIQCALVLFDNNTKQYIPLDDIQYEPNPQKP
jgi:hypothetical protein